MPNERVDIASNYDGVLVPDDRLKSIAVAWNLVHPHEKLLLRRDWPMLKPLIAELDALTRPELAE